jgi:hypothetical protein
LSRGIQDFSRGTDKAAQDDCQLPHGTRIAREALSSHEKEGFREGILQEALEVALQGQEAIAAKDVSTWLVSLITRAEDGIAIWKSFGWVGLEVFGAATAG